MNTKSSGGFTLISILIFFQLFSLFSLYGLMRASAIRKENNHIWQAYLLKLNAKNILSNLEKLDLLRLKKCSIPIKPTTLLTKKDLYWWKLNTCKGSKDKLIYYYAVESLGHDDCAIINLSQNNTQIAHYYRITLFILSDKLMPAKYFMQSTIVLPENNTANCLHKIHRVSQGRQMYREI
jgi:hypothetical protein